MKIYSDMKTQSMNLYLFHTFRLGDRCYLINAHSMTVTEIHERVMCFLAGLDEKPQHALSVVERDWLRQLKLIRSEPHERTRPAQHCPRSVTGIALMVTQRCNFRCTYCYGMSNTDSAEMDMTEEAASMAVDWLVENSGDAKNLSVTFFGGEPLLKYDIIRETVSYAEARGKESAKSFRFVFSTNGSLLTKKVVDFAVAHSIGIQVSMDGPPQVQNVNRPFSNGTGSYDIVASNLRRTIEKGRIALNCRSTITSGADPAVVREELLRLGFTRLEARLETPAMDGESGDNRQPHERDWRRMAAVAEKETAELLDLVDCRNTLKLKSVWRTFSIRDCLERFIRSKKKGFFCDAGRGYVAVTPNGDVYMCHRFAYDQRFRIGSIFDDDVYRPLYAQNQTDAQAKCRTCFARHFCGGGCYHDNLAVNGLTTVPAEDQCQLVRRQVEFAAYAVAHLSEAKIKYLEEHGLIAPRPWYEDLW